MLDGMRIELAGRWPLLRRELTVRQVDEGWVVLDARRLRFACPLDLAGMVALAWTAATDARIALVAPCDGSVASYLQRMDVLRQLPDGCEVDGRVPDGQRTDRSQVLLEVCQVSADTVESLVGRAGRMIAAHYDSGVRGPLFRGVGELIDNAASHGASPSGAFMAAQAYSGRASGRPGLEFAVCDTGIGVLAHLRRNPAHRHLFDDRRALVEALRPGVTGTDEPRGNGLPDLLNVTNNTGIARFVLRSGTGIANVVAHRAGQVITPATSAPRVPGTWAWLRVRYP
jgi:hypothetical protein